MLETTIYSLPELLRERREGAVRSLIRAVGYALARGGSSEDVGRFWYESYALSGFFERLKQAHAADQTAPFASHYLQQRWALCNDVSIRSDRGGFVIESESMLTNHQAVLGFHGVTPMDMEACLETFWRLSGLEVGLEVTYTVGEERDWAIVRPQGRPAPMLSKVQVPEFTPEELAAHRRGALASGITFSVGYAKHAGDEPEQLGQFFFKVWEGSGHYDRLRERWGYGNALAYAQSLVQSRQVLYKHTELTEDLDGYLITSPSWATEIPQVMGMYGVLPDDVYRYYEGGGIAACAKLGLQYADRSNDRLHQVWIRSR